MSETAPSESTYHVVALTARGTPKGWGVGRPAFVWGFGLQALRLGRRVAIWPAEPQVNDSVKAARHARKLLGIRRYTP